MSLRTYDSNDVRRMTAALGRTSTVLSKLGHKKSVRASQRAIAFYLGHNDDGRIDAENLREWCRKLGAYNGANFAQNMTKEAKRGLVTGNIRQDGGWTLTLTGAEYAAELAADIDSMALKLEGIGETVKVKASKIKCGLCLEEVTDGEHHHKCPECGMVVHHECNDEMRNEYDRARCPSNICRGSRSWNGELRLVEVNAPDPAPQAEAAQDTNTVDAA